MTGIEPRIQLGKSIRRVRRCRESRWACTLSPTGAIWTCSSRTTPPAGLAMMTAFEGSKIRDQTVDSVGELRARTTLLRTRCGPTPDGEESPCARLTLRVKGGRSGTPPAHVSITGTDPSRVNTLDHWRIADSSARSVTLLPGSLAMKHLVLTQFGTPSESVALHDDRDPVPGPGDVSCAWRPPR